MYYSFTESFACVAVLEEKGILCHLIDKKPHRHYSNFSERTVSTIP
jgi:hypothetical protein